MPSVRVAKPKQNFQARKIEKIRMNPPDFFVTS